MLTPNNTAKSVILLVDDNVEVLQATSELLKLGKFAVQTARDGREALSVLRSHPYVSLVLLDLWMPVMDGWEFLRQKNDDAAIADVPVVVLSAIPPASLDGVEMVLHKPVDPGLLVDTVRRYCAARIGRAMRADR
jgi:CheY-like chemotaxis protein